MKKYAADNLMVLRNHYPEIYKLIRNKEYDRGRYKIEASRNGQANLFLIDETDRATTLYSRYNPELEAAKWVETLDEQVRSSDHLLICGFGLGYHIEALMETYPNKKLYVYEPEVDYLLAAIECRDLTAILKNQQIVIFTVGKETIIQNEMLHSIYRMIKGSFAYTVIPVYRKLQSETVEELTYNVRKGATKYKNTLLTLSRFQREWAENILINICQNLQSFSFAPMKGVGKGIPAVIVGSGPSLGMEIEMLRVLRNHAIIIAAGTSIQALLHHGIEPHLVVSMDPSDANKRAFDNVNIENIPFLYIPTIKHTITPDGSPYRMHAFFNIDTISEYLMNLNPQDPVFMTTSTVTGTAVQAAIYLNCSEIVFIGQDFSYPNDQYYADGVTHFKTESLEAAVKKADLFIENVNGGVNRTNSLMMALKGSVEELMDRLTYSSYYNASQVGAVIKSAKPKTLLQLYNEQADKMIEDSWFKEKMKERLAAYPEERVEFIVRRTAETFESIAEFIQLLDKVEKHLEQSKHYRQIDAKDITKWLNGFDKHWNRLVDSPVFRHIYSFLLQREYNFAERHWGDVKAEPDAHSKLLKLKECIAPLLKGIRTVTPTVQESFATLMQKLRA